MAAMKIENGAAFDKADKRIDQIDREITSLRKEVEAVNNSPIGVSEYAGAVMHELRNQADTWRQDAASFMRGASKAYRLVPIESVSAVDGEGRGKWRTSSPVPLDLFQALHDEGKTSPVVVALAMLGETVEPMIKDWVSAQALAAGCVETPSMPLLDRPARSAELRAQIDTLLEERADTVAAMQEYQAARMAKISRLPGAPVAPAAPAAPAPVRDNGPVLINVSFDDDEEKEGPDVIVL